MTVLKSIMPRFANRGIMTVDILGGNPTPVQGILEKILPEVLQNLPKAVGKTPLKVNSKFLNDSFHIYISWKISS